MNNINVAILSYPMLFQRQGGLQIQILETIAALNQLGIDARLFNPLEEQLADYDLVHVFSAVNGNYRIVQAAKDVGKLVILSPLIQPDWTRFTGWRECWLDRMVGRLTNWHVQTTYREISECLQASDALVALGVVEQNAILDAFTIDPTRISVIPNGIPQRFFSASPDLFCTHFQLKPGFVLCVAAINAYKNQLALVEALKDSDHSVVLIGSCLEPSQSYLRMLLDYPNVRYLGGMTYEDPLLASAYAAAGVFCLPSQSEVMPLCVLEALTAGTPVVMTKNHCMDTKALGHAVIEVNPSDKKGIRQAVLAHLAKPVEKSVCQQGVADLTWESVAKKLVVIYRRLLAKPPI